MDGTITGNVVLSTTANGITQDAGDFTLTNGAGTTSGVIDFADDAEASDIAAAINTVGNSLGVTATATNSATLSALNAFSAERVAEFVAVAVTPKEFPTVLIAAAISLASASSAKSITPEVVPAPLVRVKSPASCVIPLAVVLKTTLPVIVPSIVNVWLPRPW